MKLGPEDRLQLAVLEYLEITVAEPHLVWHTPNSGKRSQSEANRFKLLGVVPGVPDLILLTGRGIHFLELKAGKNKPTEAQEDFMSYARSLGWHTAIIRSLDDVGNALRAWNIRTRAAA